MDRSPMRRLDEDLSSVVVWHSISRECLICSWCWCKFDDMGSVEVPLIDKKDFGVKKGTFKGSVMFRVRLTFKHFLY